MDLPASNQTPTVKKSLNKLSDEVANLSLSITNKGYLDPRNNIAVILQSMKDSFDAFTHLFAAFAKNQKLTGGGILFKEILEQLTNVL